MERISNELPEITVESRTRTPEQVQAVLTAAGYEGFESDEASDAVSAQAEETETVADETETDERETAGEEEAPVVAAAATAEKPPAEKKPATAAVAAEKPAEEKHLSRRQRALARREAEISRLADVNTKRERELAELRREIEDLKKAKPAAATQQAAAAEDPEPTFEQFANEDDPHASYTRAVARHAARQERRESTQRDAAEAERRTADEKSQTTADAESRAKQAREVQTARWNAQIEMAKASHDDWDQVMSRQAPKPVASQAMAEALAEREDGAELCYWLQTHVEEAHALYQATLTGEKASQRQVRQMIEQAHAKFDALNVIEEEYDSDDKEDQPAAEGESRETRQAIAAAAASPDKHNQQPPARTATSQAAPTATTPPLRPKQEPIRPVGSRGTISRKSLEEMRSDDFRRLSADEYRQRREGKL